jgi:protocatechuate 3,4-dioxygenase, alpha subunit
MSMLKVPATSQTIASNGVMPTQTIGPFFHEGLRWSAQAAPRIGNASIAIAGQVLDGAGNPITDSLLEVWAPQAVATDTQALVPGWRRVYTEDAGRFAFNVPAPASGDPAAWITFFARGLLQHLFTAVYLSDDAGSTVLQAVSPARRATLIAAKQGDAYQWNIVMQGARETVFLEPTDAGR